MNYEEKTGENIFHSNNLISKIEKTEELPTALKSHKKDSKQKLKDWLNNKYNLSFLGVLLLATIIRIYYFSITTSQPLWWDESEYMALAKYWTEGIPYTPSPQRVVLFQFLISLFLRVGFNEAVMKFTLVIIPSILVVLFTYLFIKELYDEKIALISSFLTAILWLHLFYSTRLMNDELSLVFGILAMWFFWKGYIKEKNVKLTSFAAFFIALSFLLRPAGIYYAWILIAFLLITEKFSFLKKGQLWIIPLVFILTLAPHMIWSQSYHGDALAFTSAYGGPGTENFEWRHILEMINEYTMNFHLPFISEFPKLAAWSSISSILFILGLITLLPLILGFDRIWKGSKKYNNDLLMLLSIIVILGVSIFVLRSIESRWLFAMSPAIFVFTSKGIILVSDYIQKYSNKTIAVIFILLILLTGSYINLQFSEVQIKSKIDSYAPVKDAGLWIKENSLPIDSVFSRSIPQITYYAERKTYREETSIIDVTEEEILSIIKEKQPKFYMVSVFEPHAEIFITLPDKHQNIFQVAQAYGDANGQPLLIIYSINYSELDKLEIQLSQ